MFEGRDMEAEADAEERWIGTRPSQKHEPMPKEFSPEDEFRARGMGIRLDWAVIEHTPSSARLAVQGPKLGERLHANRDRHSVVFDSVHQ